MKHKKNADGYIMIFTLLIVGAAMMVIAYVGHRGSFYLPFSTMSIAREKAKALALGGIQAAIAQLSYVPQKNEQGKTESASQDEGKNTEAAGAGKQASSEEQEFLSRILPSLNRWQQFDLVENIDGIDGQIKICLMSEEGKINLNKIIDFNKGQLRGSEQSGWKAIMQELFKLMQKSAQGNELFAAFEKYIKDAKFPFNDATELIVKKEFNYFKDILFYEPSTKKQDIFYLMDIFTVWSSSDKIEPWLFSDSMNGLLGLPRVEGDDIKKRKEQVSTWLKNFKVRSQWQQDWKTILMPVYGKELRTLPKNIDSMLSANFAPRFFSVLVHGIVGQVTQRVYAILERNKRSQGNTIEYDVTIKKLYWL